MSNLLSISPLDNRYWNKVKELSDYFSEYGIIKSRFAVEILYYEYLLKILDYQQLISTDCLKDLILKFNKNDALAIKKIEETTNHDVKAIEYYIQESGVIEYPHLVHFGLTSADVSSLALTNTIRNSINENIIPSIETMLLILEINTNNWKNIPMLSRTHGQPATPTTVGKELKVFYYRLNNQLEELTKIKFSTKFGGAVGNLNAHMVSFPNINWEETFNKFVKSFGISRQKYTTQIENYDDMSSLFNNLNRICNILIDLCRDIWSYISMNYFKLKVVQNEVGSSTMPHKVNPINFENAEGNLMLASTLFTFLANKLPISRLQRDLSDSTVSRNIGVAFGHLLLAIKSINIGLKKIYPDEKVIESDLNKNSIVLAEAIQTLLRKEGNSNAYDIIKDITRGENITWENLKDIFKTNLNEKYKDSLKVSEETYKIIDNLKINDYIGNSNK
jgi:adenylosuccinate lyase